MDVDYHFEFPAVNSPFPLIGGTFDGNRYKVLRKFVQNYNKLIGMNEEEEHKNATYPFNKTNLLYSVN